MPGSNSPPYRPACSGADVVRFFGHARQHKLSADANLPLLENNTQVPNFADPPVPPTIAPYARDNIAYHAGECGGDGQPPCGPWPEPVPVNSYSSLASMQDLSVCEKLGFKIIYAYKSWHGRFGYLEREGCNYFIGDTPTCYNRPYAGTAPSVKYLGCIKSGSFTSNAPGGFASTTARGYRVDRYSGRTFQLVCSDSATAPETHYAPLQNAVQSLNYVCGKWVFDGSVIEDALNDPQYTAVPPDYDPVHDTPVGGIAITSAIVRNDHLEFTAVQFEPSGGSYDTVTWSGLADLQEPYSSADVNDDVIGLLGTWDLADDRAQPWRMDGNVTSGPLVTYFEKQPQNPDQFHDCGFVDSETQYTGEILGAPTPYAWGPYFDFRHQNCLVFVDGDPSSIGVNSYGAYSPTWAPHARQWTDEIMAGYLPTGEFRAYNTLKPGYTDIRPGRIEGCLVGSKYAEIITFGKPSHNFARPCGPRDMEERLQSSFDCTDDGNGGYANDQGVRRWIGYPCYCSDPTVRENVHHKCPPAGPGIPPYPWNDTTPKGDWCLMTWWSNFRDVGETQRLIDNVFVEGLPLCEATPGASPLRPISGNLARVDMDQMCATFSACCPFKVFLTPNGDGLSACNSITLAPPPLDLDDTYGALWQRIPKQWMQDPLWIAPHKPCGLGPDDLWREDPSDCTREYPQRPYEECLAALPPGAPALPPGCYLGTISVPVLNAGAPGIFEYPPNFGSAYLSPWLIVLGQRACIEARGSFACQYEDPEALCGEPQEVDPP